MQAAPKILLTGANGFIGSALARVLNPKHLNIVGRCLIQSEYNAFFKLDISRTVDYSQALEGIDVVIHTAARVHIMDEKCSDPLTEFRKVNTDGTLNLAQQAADSGVKRFIFISSIKVNGETTFPGMPFRHDNLQAPEDAYALSKAEAEEGLKKIALASGMEVVIIRPPLVYGKGVKGNFAAMMSLVKRNIPLPLGAIRNKRSLVAIDNLISLIVTCINHPSAANQVFLVSDDSNLSTTELVEVMAGAIGRKVMLLPLPFRLINFVAKLTGKSNLVNRLFGSLEVDIQFTKDTLSWSPIISVQEAIKKCFVRE